MEEQTLLAPVTACDPGRALPQQRADPRLCFVHTAHVQPLPVEVPPQFGVLLDPVPGVVALRAGTLVQDLCPDQTVSGDGEAVLGEGSAPDGGIDGHP